MSEHSQKLRKIIEEKGIFIPAFEGGLERFEEVFLKALLAEDKKKQNYLETSLKNKSFSKDIDSFFTDLHKHDPDFNTHIKIPIQNTFSPEDKEKLSDFLKIATKPELLKALANQPKIIAPKKATSQHHNHTPEEKISNKQEQTTAPKQPTTTSSPTKNTPRAEEPSEQTEEKDPLRTAFQKEQTQPHITEERQPTPQTQLKAESPKSDQPDTPSLSSSNEAPLQQKIFRGDHQNISEYSKYNNNKQAELQQNENKKQGFDRLFQGKERSKALKAGRGDKLNEKQKPEEQDPQKKEKKKKSFLPQIPSFSSGIKTLLTTEKKAEKKRFVLLIFEGEAAPIILGIFVSVIVILILLALYTNYASSFDSFWNGATS